MVRPLRLEVAGATYLVTAQAARGEVLFGSDAESARFLELLARTARRYGWTCLAWSLGRTRYRLLLRLGPQTLAQGMRFLNSSYSQTGREPSPFRRQLFDRRYEATPVDEARALPEAVLKTMHTPLEEALAEDLDDWPWSSHAALLGDAEAPDWLAIAPVLDAFGATPRAALERYRLVLRQGSAVARCGRRLHDAAFLDALRARRYQETSVSSPVGEASTHQALAAYRAAHGSRREAMRAAYATGCFTQRDIARYFGVHAATVSRAMGRVARWREPVVAAIRWPAHGLLLH